MDRRTLIRRVLDLIAAPYLAHAQAPRPAGKIGYLGLDATSSSNANVLLLRPAWQRPGYVDERRYCCGSPNATRSACRNTGSARA
jgi:hypothetical protein